MKLSQAGYTKKILERFIMEKCSPHDTLMVTCQYKNRLVRDAKIIQDLYVQDLPYREAIGSLFYLAGTIRPAVMWLVYCLENS